MHYKEQPGAEEQPAAEEQLEAEQTGQAAAEQPQEEVQSE